MSEDGDLDKSGVGAGSTASSLKNISGDVSVKGLSSKKHLVQTTSKA